MDFPRQFRHDKPGLFTTGSPRNPDPIYFCRIRLSVEPTGWLWLARNYLLCVYCLGDLLCISSLWMCDSHGEHC